MIQIKNRLSAGTVLLLTVLAMLLVGCGGSGGAAGTASDAAAPETRLVKHALGETEVPEEPKRIVNLTGGAGVDRLLTLGIVPVASLGAAGDETGVPRWFEDVDWPVEVRAEDIKNVATAEETANIEEIAALEPDLIIGYDYSFDGIYDELSRIAPSVAITPTNGPEWKESFRKTAEVVGREEGYEEWLRSYEDRLRELRESTDAEGKAVSLLWNGDPSAVRIYASGSQPGAIVEEAGFRLPEIAQGDDGTGVTSPNVSLEKIPELDADAIFVMTDEKNDPGALDKFEATYGTSPLWERLKAVRNDRVYPVDIYLWTNGGPTGIRDVVLTELFAAFKA
jgi:iron complex transport system substrate-binding protein